MLTAWLILANAPAPGSARVPNFPFDLDVLWTLGAFLGIVAIGAVIIAVVNRWRKKEDEDDATGDQMSSFRELYQRGELSQEEYDRIKARLGRQLRQELNMPAKHIPAPPTSPPSLPESPGPAPPNA